MKYNGVIESTLRIIEQKLSDIESWKIDNYSDFSSNTMMQNASERALQVSVEAMIDVSERILALNKKPPAGTSAENIKLLESLGVIRDSEIYTPMIRFRNFIVHRYEKIDGEIIFEILQNKLDLFRRFVDEIRAENYTN